MMKKVIGNSMTTTKLFKKFFMISVLCGFVLTGCAVDRGHAEDYSNVDPDNPKVVAEAIVDTKRKEYVYRGSTRYYINVMPNEESLIRHDWRVSKTMYNMCWHGDIAKSYDNGIVLCSDKEETEPSDNGGAEN